MWSKLLACSKKELISRSFAHVNNRIEAKIESERLTLAQIGQYNGNTVGHQGKTMIKKLTKHGNSWALVIDKPILELLKIDPELPLEVTTDGQTLIVSPCDSQERKERFTAALKKTNRKFGPALKQLAK